LIDESVAVIVRMRNLLVGAVIATAAMAPAPASAQTDEYGVKASFIRNFVAFVEWPSSRFSGDSALMICVLNDSPITSRLIDLKKAQVRDRRIQVRSIGALPDVDACHVVFVPASEESHIVEMQARFRRSGLLIIGESNQNRSGAVINIFKKDNHMAFDVDLDAARTQDLRVSSKLLALAQHVHSSQAGGPGTW
jgi:hypothetical protein